MGYQEKLEQYEQALKEAQAKIQEMQEFIEQITGAPSPYALVLQVDPKGNEAEGIEPHVLLFNQGSYLEVKYPNHWDTKDKKKLHPGGMVKIIQQTGQIQAPIPTPEVVQTGEISVITKVHNKTYAEINVGGHDRTIYTGLIDTELEEGHRVVVDGSHSVCLRDLGKPESTLTIKDEINVTWDDVGG
ncbi:MAG: hypothetical protein GTN93_33955, partial [Anaerolineae bacterium]|nr:hypothetical protein [Anaerolineae bacterium]